MTGAGPRLRRSFFDRPSPVVAPDLLGRVLVRRLLDGRTAAVRIVETEAYQEDDPASHSYRGPTARTEVMFGPPGRLYVYFTYGMHFCMNVVTGHAREGSAVLLRAGEPLEGIDAMREFRRVDDVRLLCSGPGRLCQALAVTRAENGLDLARASSMALREGITISRRDVEITTRVGIRVGVERRWRFAVRGSRFVSRGRPARLRG